MLLRFSFILQQLHEKKCRFSQLANLVNNYFEHTVVTFGSQRLDNNSFGIPLILQETQTKNSGGQWREQRLDEGAQYTGNILGKKKFIPGPPEPYYIFQNQNITSVSGSFTRPPLSPSSAAVLRLCLSRDQRYAKGMLIAHHHHPFLKMSETREQKSFGTILTILVNRNPQIPTHIELKSGGKMCNFSPFYLGNSIRAMIQLDR